MTSIYEAPIHYVTEDMEIRDKILEAVDKTENITLKHHYWCDGSFVVECFIHVEAESEKDAIRKIEEVAPNIYKRWGWNAWHVTKRG